jgi:hypothetical protein
VESDQFLRISEQTRGVADTPAIIDPQVVPDRPAGFLQPLRERQQARLRFRLVRA